MNSRHIKEIMESGDASKRKELRLAILLAQWTLEVYDEMAGTARLRACLEDPATEAAFADEQSGSDHLGSVVYNILLDNGALKFGDILAKLGPKHKLLKGVKYPQARVAAAIKKHAYIERIGAGVYAASEVK